MADTVDIKQKKRFRPVRIVLYLITLCIVIGLVKTFLIPQPKPNIAINYVEKLNQLTKPDNYNPADNAAPIYEKAFKEFKQMPEELQQVVNMWELSTHGLIWPDDYEPEGQKLLEEWLSSNKKVFDLLSVAVEKPYLWQPVSAHNNVLMNAQCEYLNMAYDISTAQCLKAKMSAMNGDMLSACEDFKVVLKFSDHVFSKPAIMESYRSAWIREFVYNSIVVCLAHAEIDKSTLNQLYAELSEFSVSIPEALTLLEFLMQAERMETEDLVQRYFTDDGNGDGYFLLDLWAEETDLHSISSFSSYTKSIDGVISYLKDKLEEFKERSEIASSVQSRKISVEKIEKYYSAFSEISKYTPYQLHKQNTSHHGKLDTAVDLSVNFFLEESLSCYGCDVEYIYDNQAKYESLMTTIAILRYKNDNGSYPQSFDQLIEAGLLDSLPIDPYSDKPLLYKRTDGNFILYSYGKDFDDDGGTKQFDWQYEDGDDILWPIPEPEKMDATMMMPGMPGMGMPGMPGMPPMPGMPGMGMPGMMPSPEQPPMDPNMIT